MHSRCARAGTPTARMDAVLRLVSCATPPFAEPIFLKASLALRCRHSLLFLSVVLPKVRIGLRVTHLAPLFTPVHLRATSTGLCLHGYS
eukprot:scaffold263907_cov45-Tisochrysis_lutea.AAC.1